VSKAIAEAKPESDGGATEAQATSATAPFVTATSSANVVGNTACANRSI
jgi:hypothetical protein